MSAKVSTDDTQWPLLIVTQHAEQLTDAERIASLEECNRVLNAHGNDPYVMVLDNRKAGALPPTQRKLMAEYMEKHAVRARSRCVGTAFVSDSAVMRAMLTAIMWLRTPEVETRVFARFDEATAWGRTKLKHRELSRSS